MSDPGFKWTERMVRGALTERYGSKPGEWLLFHELEVPARKASGGTWSRRIDLFALRAWGENTESHSIEIKVTRSDWTKELSQPEKSEPFRRQSTAFWIAAPASIVQRLRARQFHNKQETLDADPCYQLGRLIRDKLHIWSYRGAEESFKLLETACKVDPRKLEGLRAAFNRTLTQTEHNLACLKNLVEIVDGLGKELEE